VSYFRLQKAGKISPRTIHRFLNSTSRLSQNAGQVTVPEFNFAAVSKCGAGQTASVPIENCLTEGVQSTSGMTP